jgi:DNA-binding MarR family transcriptional regulator
MNYLMTQQLIERLAGLIRNESRNLLLEHGLQPVQFDALHYLSICNRYSDTPMGVTEYLGQTKGTISQTLKVLEKKLLLKKVSDEKDKRVTHLLVTDKGRELISLIFPLPIMKKVDLEIADSELINLNTSLSQLLNTIQRGNQFKAFRQCHTCRHNLKLSKNEFFCNLTKENLSNSDVKLICREHEESVL